MQRKFLTSLSILLFLNLLVKPLWFFGIDREVQNIVGAESYGLYLALLSLTIILNILLDFGIRNFNNRNIAQNEQLLGKHLSGILIIRLLFGVLYFVIVFAVALLLGYRDVSLQLLGFLAFNQFLFMTIQYLRSNISGLMLFKTDSVLSVLDRLIMILLAGFLIYNNATRQQFTIEWFVYTQTAAYLLTAIITFIIVVKKAKFIRLTWNWPFIVLIIRKSFPYALLILLMTFYNRFDPIILERMLPAGIGAKQAGIYAHGFRVLDFFNNIAVLFSVILLPLFARMIKMKENLTGIIRLTVSILFTTSVIIAIGTCFYAFEIMDLMYDAEISESARIFAFMMFNFIAIAMTYIFGTLLTANGSLKTLNMVAAIGVLINLLLNFLLVPKMLAMGSVVASLSAQFFTALVQIILAARLFNLELKIRYLLVLASFAAFVLLITYFSKMLPFDWMLNFGLMVTVSAIAAFALKLLNLKELWIIIKNR